MLQITTPMNILLLLRSCHNFSMESTARRTLFCITLSAILFKVSKLAAIYSARVFDCSCWNIFNCSVRIHFDSNFRVLRIERVFSVFSAGWPRLGFGTTWIPSWSSRTTQRNRRRSTIGWRTTPKPINPRRRRRWRQKVQRGESRPINHPQSKENTTREVWSLVKTVFYEQLILRIAWSIKSYEF